VKRLAVVGVVIVVLFLGAVNVGIGRNDGNTRPGWIVSLRRALSGTPAALTTDDFSGPCIEGATLVTVGRGRCHLSVRASPRPSREADLVLAKGTSAQVTLAQPGTVKTDVTVRPGTKERVSVFKKGGDLDVDCPGAASCTINLVKAQD
jgi:hypothetical protein